MTRCEACRYNVDARCIQEDLARIAAKLDVPVPPMNDAAEPAASGKK